MAAKIKRSANYLPPKTGAYPQLKPTKDHKTCLVEQYCKATEDCVDPVTKRYKRFRFVVPDDKAMCITVLGMPDDLEMPDDNLVVSQLFGTPGCLERKCMTEFVICLLYTSPSPRDS